ncbi:MAG: PRC-barrel domain-containing protein [Hyphomicrobium sp.]|nr:PRC-barrel domain-containing protein [Hyphomicrobium sp.]
MKSTSLIIASLMLSTAAIAQDTPPEPATPATPPAATDTAPAPSAAPAEVPASPAPSELPSTTADNSAAPVLSDEQAAALKNKVVWSSDQKNIGEVAEVVRDNSGRVTELHADIGGFLGFGETRVRISPGEFKIVNDRVELTRTEEQAENLPEVTDN